MRQIVAEAVNTRAAGDPLRTSLKRVWRSTLDVWFLVEPQPIAEHSVGVGRIEPNGQPVPRIQLRYPSYFTACIDRVLGYIRSRLPRATAVHVGSVPTSFHWMGATRMSHHAREGCVDASLRHHECENLYVLSSSVFPSASSANPTLTLAALALRLGDELGVRCVPTDSVQGADSRRLAARGLASGSKAGSPFAHRLMRPLPDGLRV